MNKKLKIEESECRSFFYFDGFDKKILSIMLMIFIATISLATGIILGMIIQQMVLTTSMIGVAENLEGVSFNIEVDINETIFVDRMIEYFNNTNGNLYE